ncbi:MAG: beta-propeller domain-containing protein [Gammaproteobacteria bacterium]|nr:beta-propeller domain-containing protein [Gammaproteobacteria bacterium]MDH4313998.1 beta-propeller domain-containing protein [Gammaproteobacteria bacterium]MDH5212732.1 beta-propeller domain-containing protein [Gammaproteobacteria bacterium]MDH5500130.1 beta-propeller domain-containing protein [Gammaproteobacteria bacterium]
MYRHLLQMLTLGVATGVFLAGCGSGGSDPAGQNPPPPPPSGMLRKVGSASELEASIKGGLTAIRSSQSLGITAGSGATAAGVPQYSGTYTQEANVDEYDSVKYDGEFLFVAPMRQQYPCCWLAAQSGGSAPPPADRSIRILETDPASGGATEVSRIPLEDDVSVQGLYRTADRLVAMTSTSFYGSYGDAWSSLAIWAPEQSGIAVYDTSDIAQPALLFDALFEGIFIESRRIGDTVYVVSRYTPNIDGLIYNVTTAADQAANQALLNNVSLGELLPAITINGNATSLVTPENCFVPSGEAPAYPVITSITAIPLNNPAAFTTTCYNDDAYGIYVSESSMYLAQSQPEGTRVHKFGLGAGSPDYAGSADILGILWRGGQADFRMSEKDGILRAFTSTYDGVAPDFIDHHLILLQESTTSAVPELETVSQLPNASRPEEIGKPNEQLYGVRFIGDRAYAVTFERIDPLYVFDLSDPSDPQIAGTLDITGFSDLLHPVSDDLLLGVGTSDNNAVKLELFDVSNIAQPLSLGSDVLGGRGSYSEAINDRHAFTYLADVNGVDRFTIPADLTADDDSYQMVESGLYLYEIRDKATPALASLNAVGSVVVHDENEGVPYYFSRRSRAILHDDTIYYVRDDEVFSTVWGNPQAINGPL